MGGHYSFQDLNFHRWEITEPPHFREIHPGGRGFFFFSFFFLIICSFGAPLFPFLSPFGAILEDGKKASFAAKGKFFKTHTLHLA